MAAFSFFEGVVNHDAIILSEFWSRVYELKDAINMELCFNKKFENFRDRTIRKRDELSWLFQNAKCLPVSFWRCAVVRYPAGAIHHDDKSEFD